MPMQYPHYIACAMLSYRTADENKACLAQAQAIATTLNVPFVLVKGAYNGSEETSLQLFGPNAERCARVLAIAFLQETYLAVYDFNTAELCNQDGMVTVNFCQRVDGTADNYTEDTLGNRYTFI